jgi:hypothetical protein
MWDAPVIDRCDESGNVADHASSEPDDKRLPIQPGSDHLVTNRAGLLERLRFLPRGNCDQGRLKIR